MWATQTVSYTYDELGRKHTVSGASGTTTYGYDAQGNLTLEDTPEGVIHYVYNSATGRNRPAEYTSANLPARASGRERGEGGSEESGG